MNRTGQSVYVYIVYTWVLHVLLDLYIDRI